MKQFCKAVFCVMAVFVCCSANAQYTQNICSGASINFAPPGNPSSLTYKWGVPVVNPAGAVNATPQATPVAGVIQTLTNSTTANATVTYSVQASDLSTFTLVVTVKPTPVLTNSTASTAICSGATFAYTAASATSGTVITWSRALSAGITPNTNSGSGSISEALFNTTDNPLTATYIYSLTANGCTNSQTLNVVVNPKPVLTSTLTPADVCSGSTFAYTPLTVQDPNVTYNWSRATVAGISNSAAAGTNSPNEVLVNTTLAAVPVSYAYALQNTATGCTNNATVTVNVNPQPSLSSGTSNVVICSGTTFNYNPTSLLGGTSITWSRASVVGISPNSGLGNGNISETLVNNSNVTPVTATYDFSLSNLGCTRTQSFTVTVNPKPALSSAIVAPSICSGTQFNYTPTSAQQPNVTFFWSRAAVAGISNGAATGSGNPLETLTNTTLLSITVVYAFTTTNFITGCSNTENVFVTVNPIPSISNFTVSTCRNQGFLVYPSPAPTGTTYTWPTPVISPSLAVSGGSAQAIPLPYVGQSLDNNTGSAATATYTVTPNTFGCIGSTFTVTVTVNTGVPPSISLSSSLTPPAICSGTTFNYTPTSTAPAPTFAWQRFYAAGISNAPASGTNDPNEVLTNTTTAAVTVQYGFTVSSGGCANTQYVSVQVNPSTQLNTTLTPAAICNNTVFSYVPGSNTATTNSYAWSRSVVAGISNIAASGNGNPNETLVNTSSAPVTVNYDYTLNTTGNCPNVQTVSVVVNPAVTLSSALSLSAMCSGNTLNYTPTSAVAGTLFSWTRNAVAGISNLLATGTDNPAEQLVNTTTSAITVTYNYTLVANTCSNTQSVTVVVKPTPAVPNQLLSICSNSSFSVNPVAVPIGTQYTWAAPTSVPLGVVTGGSAGTLQNSISQLLTNGSVDPGVLYYTVTPSVNGCTGLDFAVTVTVNPVPIVADHVLPAICSGTSFSYAPTGIPSNTVFAWSNPLITPSAGLTGGSAQSGQIVLSQQLNSVNNVLNTAVYTVTPSASGCAGASFQLTVPVSPVPVVGTQAVSICSANTFNVSPSSIPAGTAYTWTAPSDFPAGAVSGQSPQAIPVGSISQLLTNTTFLAAQAQYTVVPIAGSCAGNTFTVNVGVNPSTQLSSSLTPAAVCNNTLFSYVPTSNTPSTNTFNWTRPAVAGISNAVAAGAGNPNETLVNTTTSPVTVTYNYFVSTTAGCSIPQSVNVVVNPSVALSTTLTPAAICSGNTFSYIPASNTGGATFSWSRNVITGINNPAASGTGNPAEMLVNSSLANVDVPYIYTITANGCSSSQTVTVAVKPIPVVGAQAVNMCSNGSFTISPSNVPVGTQYTWGVPVSSPVGVISGSAGTLQNNISQTLGNSTLGVATATYTVTPIANGCTGNTFTIAATVNPIPVVADQVIAAVCSGSPFVYSPLGIPPATVFSWNNPVVTPIAGLTGGSAQGNQAVITQTLIATNNAANTAVYTIIPSLNGCAGNSFQLTVPVNPTPSVADQLVAICSGNSFTVAPSAVPSGTSYTWGTPTGAPVGAISGNNAQSLPVLSISQLLNNTTSLPAQSVYTVLPASGSCVGNSFRITVTVNPTPRLNISTNAGGVCSNTNFSYNAASSTPGTTLQWTRLAVTGVSNPTATGFNNPNEQLINITNTPVNVSYLYNLSTTDGCFNTQTVTVAVNPIPVMSSLTNPAAICSGTTFHYVPTSNVNGSVFTWTRSVQAFIGNAAAAGVYDPSEILVNTSVNTAPVDYNFTATANGCSSKLLVTVPVSPAPAIANQSTTVCSGSNAVFTPAVAVPAGTTYTWAAPVYSPAGTITGGQAQPSAQTAISMTLNSQTLNAATATYTVTPSAGGCNGASFTLAAMVQPVPTIPGQLVTNVCSGATFNYAPANVPAVTTYTWGTPVATPFNGVNGAFAQSVPMSSISQSLSTQAVVTIPVAYTVTPVANGCTGNDFTLTVQVNPTPAINDIYDTICTGSTFVINPSSIPVNTRYTWGAPTIQPFGAILGASAQLAASGNISQRLINTTNSPARVAYLITPSAGTCAGTPFTLFESVGSNLPSIANQAATICSGTAFNTTPANAPPGTTYTWTVASVTPAGSASGMSNAILRQTLISQVLDNVTLLNSNVIYSVVAHNTGCNSNTFQSNVTVLPVPRVNITGNSVICRYPFDTVTVNFISGTAPWSFTYDDGTGARSISGVTNAAYPLRLPATPNPTRLISVTNVAFGACLNTSDTSFFAQKINPLPIGRITSMHGLYICHGIPDTMFISAPPGDTLSYQWTRNGFSLPGATTDSIATVQGGRYNAILTNQYGCIDTVPTPILLTTISKPVLKFSFDSYCINNLIRFTNLTDTNFIGSVNWLWDMGDSTSSSVYNSTATYRTSGSRHVRLTVTQLYCENYPTSLDSTINIEFPIAGIRMPSVSAYKGRSTPLSGRTIPGYHYKWTPTRGIDRPDSSQVNFNQQVSQEYLYNVISPGGCVTYDTVLVRVFEDKLVDIMVPKSFTPNGDGINDVLYPYLAGVKTFRSFKIFNRYGKLMFETSNPDTGWNGTWQGVQQPMAIYIWVATGIAEDGSPVEKRGETLLLR